MRPMVVFGSDLAAVFNFENATPVQVIAQMGSLIFVSLPLYLGFLSLLLRWLFIGFLQPVFPKQMARIVRLVTRSIGCGQVPPLIPLLPPHPLLLLPPTHRHPCRQALAGTKAATKAGAEGNSVQHDVMNRAPPELRAVVSLGSPSRDTGSRVTTTNASAVRAIMCASCCAARCGTRRNCLRCAR